MSKFKVGDRVRIIGNSNHSCNKIGEAGTIEEVDTYLCLCRVLGDITKRSFDSNWSHDDEIELINNNMSLKEKFITAFLSEPEKTFRQKGITNGDGLLTQEGQTVFISFLLKKYGAEFKTEVADKLPDDK